MRTIWRDIEDKTILSEHAVNQNHLTKGKRISVSGRRVTLYYVLLGLIQRDNTGIKEHKVLLSRNIPLTDVLENSHFDFLFALNNSRIAFPTVPTPRWGEWSEQKIDTRATIFLCESEASNIFSSSSSIICYLFKSKRYSRLCFWIHIFAFSKWSGKRRAGG